MTKKLKIVQTFSGGIDSSTLLTYLLDQGHEVKAIGFDYGQRHKKELEMATEFARSLGVSFRVISLCGLTPILNQSSLTNTDIDVPDGHYEEKSMKATVVPNRNMIMLSAAIGCAENLNYNTVAIANHAGDHTIYPDCRPEFIEAMDKASQLATYNKIKVLSPFKDISKSEIVALGKSLSIDYNKTWSCYKGGDAQCGICGTCTERLEALAEAGEIDVTSVLKEIEQMK